jgi:hypothetical protein
MKTSVRIVGVLIKFRIRSSWIQVRRVPLEPTLVAWILCLKHLYFMSFSQKDHVSHTYITGGLGHRGISFKGIEINRKDIRAYLICDLWGGDISLFKSVCFVRCLLLSCAFKSSEASWTGIEDIMSWFVSAWNCIPQHRGTFTGRTTSSLSELLFCTWWCPRRRLRVKNNNKSRNNLSMKMNLGNSVYFATPPDACLPAWFAPFTPVCFQAEGK